EIESRNHGTSGSTALKVFTAPGLPNNLGIWSSGISAQAGVSSASSSTSVYSALSFAAPTPKPLPGSIAGMVFRDSNGNGKPNKGEPDLKGWTIDIDRLVNGKDVLVATVVT